MRITSSRAGVFIENDDPNEMARVIVELAGDKDKSREVGEFGLIRSKELSWERVSSPLIEAYARLFENG